MQQGRRGVWQGAGDMHKKTIRYKGHWGATGNALR